MGLEQYIVALVTFVNNIFIPFLMGLAFLFFVVNAFRFFIVGGANEEGREKAKSLAVYGVLAFVLIIIFWGIVGLLTSSLGLQALGERTEICSDYDPLCNDGNSFDQGPRSRATVLGQAGNPVDPGPTTRPITPISNDSSGPTTRPIVTNGTELLDAGGPQTRPSIIGLSGNPQDPGPSTRPTIDTTPGRVAEDVENFASSFNPIEYGDRFNSVIEESIAILADPNGATDERAQAAVLLEMNGYINESELANYISVLNAERSQLQQGSLDMTAVRSEAVALPDTLISEIQQTQSTLRATLAENNRRWYDVLGEPNQNAQQEALAQVEELYSYPADPDRIAAFDMLFAGNPVNQEVLATTRSRMIEEINAERFYIGFGPLISN
jgi:hypothetical protein